MNENPRLRGLRPNPENLGVAVLEPGEVSRPVRIRASNEVHQRLKQMTAKEIGEVLAQVLECRSLTEPG